MFRTLKGFLGTAALTAILAIILPTSSAYARNVYLNGVDISNAQNQDLRGVSIHINERGDIFIIAPHYQVNEEETFIPLSQYRGSKPGTQYTPPKGAHPAHRLPRPLPTEMPIPAPLQQAPENSAPAVPEQGAQAPEGALPKPAVAGQAPKAGADSAPE